MADIKADTDCNVQVGFKAVYRISFALAIFFFAFYLLMLKVKTSKDPRAAIHNGYVRFIYYYFVILWCGPSHSAVNVAILMGAVEYVNQWPRWCV